MTKFVVRTIRPDSLVIEIGSKASCMIARMLNCSRNLVVLVEDETAPVFKKRFNSDLVKNDLFKGM